MEQLKESGIEWIGDIPKNWAVHPVFTYFCERKKKNTNFSERNLLSLSYGTIKRKNIDSNNGLLPKNFASYNIVECGDIVIRPTDLQNDKKSLRTGLVTEKGIITSAYITLCPLKNVNSRFFHYLLHSYDVQKVFYNMGNGVRQCLNYSEFSKLLLLAPTLIKQGKIANFLDNKCSEIDSLATDIQKEISILEEYKKSVITDAVTKGIVQNVEMKNAKINWIGKIPKTWTISRLKFLLKEKMKYGASESGVDYSAELPRYVRITDILPNNKLKDENKLSLTKEQSKGFILEDGTVLFARSGGTVGKTFLYNSEMGVAAYAGYLISAVANSFVLLPEWLFYFSLSRPYLTWVELIFSQSTIQNINADKYSNMPLTLPPIEEQKSICLFLKNKCSEIDKSISEKQSQLEILAEYKNSLIYEYVTGKKEVI